MGTGLEVRSMDAVLGLGQAEFSSILHMIVVIATLCWVPDVFPGVFIHNPITDF